MKINRPGILTINDKAAEVVQSAQTYERMTEALSAHAESIQNIRRALSEESRHLKQFTREFEALYLTEFKL